MSKIRVKSSAPKKPDVPPAKLVQKQAQVEVVIRLIASNGDKYRDESYEEFLERLRQITLEEWPGANFTATGGYYLVDGKVCRVEDFDRETMNRKPGTHPPSWSLAGEDKKEALLAERNAEQEKNPNKMAHQPSKLLTSKELDEVATPRKTVVAAKPKKTVVVRKKEVPVSTTTKSRVRVRRRSS